MIAPVREDNIDMGFQARRLTISERLVSALAENLLLAAPLLICIIPIYLQWQQWFSLGKTRTERSCERCLLGRNEKTSATLVSKPNSRKPQSVRYGTHQNVTEFRMKSLSSSRFIQRSSLLTAWIALVLVMSGPNTAYSSNPWVTCQTDKIRCFIPAV